MAATGTNTGNTSEFSFTGWTTFAASLEIVEIDPPREFVEMFKSSHLGTTGHEERKKKDLLDTDPFTIMVKFDGDTLDLGTGETGTAKIFWPLLTSGNSEGASFGGSAVMLDIKPGPLTNEGEPTAVITFQFDGMTGPAWLGEQSPP